MAPSQEFLSAGLPAERTGPVAGEARGPFSPSEPSQPTLPAGTPHFQNVLPLSGLGACALCSTSRSERKFHSLRVP